MCNVKVKSSMDSIPQILFKICEMESGERFIGIFCQIDHCTIIASEATKKNQICQSCFEYGSLFSLRCEIAWNVIFKIAFQLLMVKISVNIRYKSLIVFSQYRVSHIEMNKVNWLWQMDRLRFPISHLRWLIQEVMTFGFFNQFSKK